MDYTPHQNFGGSYPASFTGGGPRSSQDILNIAAAVIDTPKCSGMDTLAPRPCDKIEWLVPKSPLNAQQPNDTSMRTQRVHEMASFYADVTFGKPERCQCGCNRTTWQGQRTLDQKSVLVELMVFIFRHLPEHVPRTESLMGKLARIISSGFMVRKGLPLPRTTHQEQDDEMDGSFQGQAGQQQQQAQPNDNDMGDLCNFLRALAIL